MSTMTTSVPEVATTAARAPSSRQAPPATLAIFGSAGDLTKRLVVPALYNLVRAGRLADGFSIIGVDISDQTDESWRNSLTEMMQAFVRAGAGAIDEQAWSWLTRRMRYLRGDFAQPETYSRLAISGRCRPVLRSGDRAARPRRTRSPVRPLLAAGDRRKAVRARLGIGQGAERANPQGAVRGPDLSNRSLPR